MIENVFIAEGSPANKMYDFIRSQEGGVTLTVARMGGSIGVGYTCALRVLHALESAGLIKSRHIGKTLGNRKKHYEATTP